MRTPEEVVSIRAPVTRPERRFVFIDGDHSIEVSIRAPVTRPERRGSLMEAIRDALFQSALRSRDRSDAPALLGGITLFPFQSALRSRDRSDPPI